MKINTVHDEKMRIFFNPLKGDSSTSSAKEFAYGTIPIPIIIAALGMTLYVLSTFCMA